jgi:HEAT repeat protein
MYPPILLLVSLGLFAHSDAGIAQITDSSDVPQLREVLHDRQDPRAQSQAALLLVQSTDLSAEKAIRQDLHNLDNEEPFIALAGALRLRQDSRFLDELIAALSANKPRVRQAAAEALAACPVADLVRRLDTIARDPRAEPRLRQTVLWTLGRCGRKEAARILMDFLSDPNEDIRRLAAGGLTDLTGQTLGTDLARWKSWWERTKDCSDEQWLQQRLSFQATRAQRLEGELLRSRAQVLRLHQQLYSRLPIAERFAVLPTMLDQEDPGVRALVIVWCLDLLPAATDGERQKTLASCLMQLTRDSTPDVQRGAVLALGRMPDATSFERLTELAQKGSPVVKSAAIRALSSQARSTAPETQGRAKIISGLLHKLLEDKSLEVVIEAAEALGAMGNMEAAPKLTALLSHASEGVRQTAAHALDRTATAELLDDLQKGLQDSNTKVRFSIVGAIGKALSNSPSLSNEKRKGYLDRLEVLLQRDGDAGVRSRVATVLGECGTHESLNGLWQQMQVEGEGQVQEKAWDAFVEIATRTVSVPLLERWDKTMATAKMPTRRVQLWARVYSRWEQSGMLREQATQALEGLVQAEIAAGKWATARPLIQSLLARSNDMGETTRSKYLKWVLQIGRMALSEGNKSEALRLVQEAKPYLVRGERVSEEFESFEKELGRTP